MSQIVLTPAELLAIVSGNTPDENGNIVLTEAGAAAIFAAVKRSKRKSERKERVNLSDPKVLAEYKAKMIRLLDENMEEIARGGKLISERKASLEIGLGKSTVEYNSILHNIYLTYKRSMSVAAPATLDNDADADWDEDFD